MRVGGVAVGRLLRKAEAEVVVHHQTREKVAAHRQTAVMAAAAADAARHRRTEKVAVNAPVVAVALIRRVQRTSQMKGAAAGLNPHGREGAGVVPRGTLRISPRRLPSEQQVRAVAHRHQPTPPTQEVHRLRT
jgi:hypothetical protein